MSDRRIVTIYIGGGTPTCLNPASMEEILWSLKHSFAVLPEAEISMECNPGTVDLQKLLLYRRLGVNRLSIGLQSAQEKELKCLGRIHDVRQFLSTFEMAKTAGFENVNVDLMTGLPKQTMSSLTKTLELVCGLAPAHISAYGLMIEEGTPFFDRYREDWCRQQARENTEFLPDEDTEYEMYRMTQQFLVSHGYRQYEISNYAKEGFACKHNMVYWTRRPYLGMGLGASSFLDGCRSRNESDMDRYMEACRNMPQKWQEGDSPLWVEKQRLTGNDAMEEFMFLGLRMTEGVAGTDFYRCFGCAMEDVYGQKLKELQTKGLLEQTEGRVFLTDRGRDVSNVVLADFLLK